MNEPTFFYKSQHQVAVDHYDLVSYFLFDAGVSGIVETDTDDQSVTFSAFWENHDLNDIKALWNNLITRQNWPTERFQILSIEKGFKENWQENWKEHFKPLEIGRSFYVIPPWETKKTEKRNIIINPGMGFGTGYHESTSLALENLEWIFKQSEIQSVADIGTGSGILLIATLLCSEMEAFAVDIDPEATAEVPENLKLSGLNSGSLTLKTGGPETLSKPVDLVIANIIAEVLIEMKKDLEKLMKPGGYLLLSGIFHELKDECLAAFEDQLTLLNEKKEGDWYSLVFKKPLE